MFARTQGESTISLRSAPSTSYGNLKRFQTQEEEAAQPQFPSTSHGISRRSRIQNEQIFSPPSCGISRLPVVHPLAKTILVTSYGNSKRSQTQEEEEAPPPVPSTSHDISRLPVVHPLAKTILVTSYGNSKRSQNQYEAAVPPPSVPSTSRDILGTFSAQVQTMPKSKVLIDKYKFVENSEFPYCDLESKYHKIAKIGQGTFGEVFKAQEKSGNKRFVAMKKVLMENCAKGFPITALREINILQKLKHENVINLIEICRTEATKNNAYRTKFYLVFDFCEHDLAGLLSNRNVKFTLGEIKSVIQQLFKGLSYIHSKNVLHRDLKSANILITKEGILKLADFGLARNLNASKKNNRKRFTQLVVTLWYRPPELLLGARNYGPSVDMWGAGCVMAELWTRSPLLQGNTEQEQLHLISQLCGSLTPNVWPGIEDLQLYRYVALPKNIERQVQERLKPVVIDRRGCDLLDKLLTLDPKKRIDAKTALDHEFFHYGVLPKNLSRMLSQHEQSMFEYLITPRGNAEMSNYHQKYREPQYTGLMDRVW